MWEPLIRKDQLKEGLRIRQVVLDGDYQHEAIYKITLIGNHYFRIIENEKNKVKIEIDKQSVFHFRIDNVEYYVFEIETS